MVETIENLVDLNNQFYSNAPIEVSIGAATSRPGERLEELARRADAAMYEAKREFYAARERQRRLSDAAA